MMGLLAAVVLLASMGASHAVVRIGEDRGGRIGTYVDKYQEVRTSGEMVIIDGLCASACTIVLGAIPHDKICVTSHAALGFHAAWDLDDEGHAMPVRDFGDRLDVANVAGGIADALAKHRAGVLVDQRLDRPRLVARSEPRLDALAGQHMGEERVCRAVELRRRDDIAAAVGERHDRIVQRGLTRGRT